MYYLAEGDDKHTRFRNAVLLALLAHAALIGGVAFEGSDVSSSATQIEVTLNTRPAQSAPEDALHIAQENQVGNGQQAEFSQISSASSLAAMAAQQQENPSQQNDPRAEEAESLITTVAMSNRATAADAKEAQPPPASVEGISPEVDRLAREMANLEAEFDQQARTFTNQPRVRRLTSASAKQSADAAYLLDWRQRLEAVGNRYYPEASVRYGIYGDVRLLVVILQDGSLEDVKVLSSSGYAVLDEAAIKVVRMAAPYSPFPAELKATTDKLEIIRTWQYLENQLSSAQR